MTVDRTAWCRTVSGAARCDLLLSGQPMEISMIVSESNRRLGLLLPTTTRVEEVASHRARLTLEPLERGFGTTLGAALRRILLSSLEGCAPTQVTLAQVAHEQAAPAGLSEDIVQMLRDTIGWYRERGIAV
ncbi:MAG: hypothetical protein ABI564_03105, partial [Ideonella sp.]